MRQEIHPASDRPAKVPSVKDKKIVKPIRQRILLYGSTVPRAKYRRSRFMVSLLQGKLSEAEAKNFLLHKRGQNKERKVLWKKIREKG